MSETIAVATMTLARDRSEEEELLGSLAALVGRGYPIAVTDGGSRESFVEALRALPGVLVETTSETRGLVGQVRNSLALARAWRTDRILYTEPDKAAFFAGQLDGFLASAAGMRSSVVLASRSDASFATFPPSQQYAERVLNNLCADVTGCKTDYLYGPFLLDPTLVDLVAVLPSDLGWGWRTCLFVLANRAGGRLASITDEFECPVSQRADSAAERDHRMRQLAQNISGIAHGLQFDLSAGHHGVG
jgi:hypothetical protein